MVENGVVVQARYKSPAWGGRLAASTSQGRRGALVRNTPRGKDRADAQ